MKEILVSDVVYREDLYPRIKHDPATIQRYAENLDVLPPIEINQHNILIDGFHRWTAHRKAEAQKIKTFTTETVSETELFAFAIERNAKHGLQASDDDKKKASIRLYAGGTGYSKDEIARLLSVSTKSVQRYLSDIDKQLRAERQKKIFDMWLACYTHDEISASVGIARQSVGDEEKNVIEPQRQTFAEKGQVSLFGKSRDFHLDSEFSPPIYNVWAFAKKSNEVSHFGNSEQRIVDNLLYLYTSPFDIVIDPFAGGGSTIDVCKKRMRRYWVSDRKPIVERENEIRMLDIVSELPSLANRWSNVSLTYLDPPYWKQAQEKYSKDKEDLANMSLEDFTTAISSVINRIASKQSKGVIALLIQPTQWNAPERQFTDHVMDILKSVKSKKIVLENRISCPYSTEQCTPQMVDWAKANKKLLVISRELIVWRFI